MPRRGDRRPRRSRVRTPSTNRSLLQQNAPLRGFCEADARTRTGDPFIRSSEQIRAPVGRLRVWAEEPGFLAAVCGSRRAYPSAGGFHKASRANHGPSVGALLLRLKAGVPSVPVRTAAFPEHASALRPRRRSLRWIVCPRSVPGLESLCRPLVAESSISCSRLPIALRRLPCLRSPYLCLRCLRCSLRCGRSPLPSVGDGRCRSVPVQARPSLHRLARSPCS